MSIPFPMFVFPPRTLSSMAAGSSPLRPSTSHRSCFPHSIPVGARIARPRNGCALEALNGGRAPLRTTSWPTSPPRRGWQRRQRPSSMWRRAPLRNPGNARISSRMDFTGGHGPPISHRPPGDISPPRSPQTQEAARWGGFSSAPPPPASFGIRRQNEKETTPKGGLFFV